jgi:ABC-2 type transport system permease protein
VRPSERTPKGGKEGEREVAAAWPMLIAQTKSELLQLLRDPAFVISSVALPTIFFAFFGLPVVEERTAGTGAGAYLLASFGAYGVISVMLFSFGAGVAAERGRKTDVLMRATPLRPAVLLCAKTLSALLFAFVTLVVLFFFGRVAGGVEPGMAVWATLTYRLLLGSTPFVFLGFAVGYLARPTSAAAVIQLIYLPIAFASGLFVPLGGLPEIVQQIAPYLPTYRYAELAWSAVGANTKPLLASALWLTGYGVAFLAAAIWAYRREDIRRFG